MLDPTYWGKDNSLACKLILEVRCQSGKEAEKIRALIIELVMREYGIKPRTYRFEVEK